MWCYYSNISLYYSTSFWESSPFLNISASCVSTSRLKTNDTETVQVTFLTLMTKTEFQMFLCSVKMTGGHWVLLAALTVFHLLSSTGFYWSHHYSLVTALTAKRIPLDDCSEPAMLWLRASPVYISLMDSHSNLPEQTYPSCIGKPLENASLWQFQACLTFQMDFLRCSFLQRVSFESE